MDQNEPILICDTNIWYRLSDGRILPAEVAGKRLVGTFINGFEFCSSPNGLKDYAQLRHAIICFDHYANEFYKEPPLEYMKLVSGHPSTTAKWDEIYGLLKLVKRVEVPSKSHEPAAQVAYHEHANQIEKDNQGFLDMIEDHREQIKYKGVHKKWMSEAEVRYQHKEITKRVIINTVGDLALDWDALDLYLSTFDEWIRQLSMQHSLKIKPNDWNDLLSLAYVRPGTLYWTRDYRKTWEFIQSCGCGHYLYEPFKVIDDTNFQPIK